MDYDEPRRLVEDAELLFDMLSDLIELAKTDDPDQRALKVLADFCTAMRPTLDSWLVAKMAAKIHSQMVPSSIPVYCAMPKHTQPNQTQHPLTSSIYICQAYPQDHVFCKNHHLRVCVECGAQLTII